MKRVASSQRETVADGVTTTTTTEPSERCWIYFWSAAKAPYYRLSNLNAAPILFKREHVPDGFPNRDRFVDWLGDEGQRFASAEHLWQALKANNKQTFLEFTAAGELGGGEIEGFFRCLLPPGDAAKKAKRWRAKNMVGITAKMAVSLKHREKLDLVNRLEDEKEHLDPATERAVWMAILEQKFKQNVELAQLLASTGDALLVEFDRSTRNPLREQPPHWGGCYDETTKQVMGENVMGRYLMAVRDSLRRSE